MRDHLNRLLKLDRIVIDACPHEEYFAAGPTTVRQFDRAKADTVIAKLRRSRELVRSA